MAGKRPLPLRGEFVDRADEADRISCDKDRIAPHQAAFRSGRWTASIGCETPNLARIAASEFAPTSI
jgi:hypothetical protein